ncbi:MAG: hypothetical protein M1816_007175 [Peltula sp. TS41687]|nr:MAG: hypothetical protein M1816_007175 [Peltula sp. TS41687]
MIQEVPAGLLTVDRAARMHGDLVSFIGIVTDFLTPVQTRGTDWQVTFTITGRPQGIDDLGLKVKIFRPTPEEFPPVQSTGDVVILRKIKINSWNGSTVALSNIATEWTLVPASKIPDKQPAGDFKLPHASSPGAERPSTAEYRYIVHLHNTQNGNSSATSTEHRMPLQTVAHEQTPRQGYPAQAYSKENRSYRPTKSVELTSDHKRSLPGVPVQYSNENGHKVATPSTAGHRSNHKPSYAVRSVEYRESPKESTPNPSVPSSSYGGSLKPKITLIKDIKEFAFSDLVVQVLKISPSGGERLELSVTDYTANNHLFNYEWSAGGSRSMGADGDEYGYALNRRYDNSWPGPYGKQTLLVTLWSPHSFHAQTHVKEGDNVFLRNVRIKFNKDGGTRLEGWLSTNKTNPNRIDVSVIKNEEDERVQALLERKRAYWKRQKSQEAEYLGTTKKDRIGKAETGNVGKRRVEELDSEREAEEVLDTRPEKKKKKRPRKAKAKQQPKPQPEKEVIGPSRGVSSDNLEVNPHIRSQHLQVKPIRLSELAQGINLDLRSPLGVNHVLPFHNLCCRARVKVVDFFPPKLEDFAVPPQNPEFDDLSDSGGSHSSRDSAEIAGPWQHVGKEVTKRAWEWRFYLLVEDAYSKSTTSKDGNVCRLKLMVDHNEAEFLLNMSPEDLRKNPTALGQLREKLFVLWGDLEERKSAAAARALQEVSNSHSSKVSWYKNGGEKDQVKDELLSHSARPFECCIKEYGVAERRAEGEHELDVQRWERRFMLFGTTIA